MASAASQRATAAMTTATRGSRFPNFTMGNGNGNEKSPQPLGATSFSSSSWQPDNIWGSSTIGTFGKRDTIGSRGSSTDEAFPNGPSGSSALAATSEADVWVNRGGPWNNTDSPRNASGGTSPSRIRDASVHEMPITSQYFTSSQPQMQPAIGQRGGNLPSRQNPGQMLDPSAGSYKFAQFPDYADDNEHSRPFGATKFEAEPPALRSFRSDKRGSQDPSYLAVSVPTSRDPSIPSAGHSDADPHLQGNVYNDFPYVGHTPNSVHGHRSSLSALSGSFATQTTNTRALVNNLDEEEFQEKFTRSLSFNESPAGPSNGTGAVPSYSNGASQAFQLNPVSQPWDTGKVHGNGTGYPSEPYADSSAVSYLNKRGVAPDRGSPANGVYRQAISSPKSYAGTPQHGVDPWPRPASRDLRTAPEAERGGAGQQFLPQQTPPYFSQPFYGTNFQPQFPTPLYDPYSAHANFSRHIQIPGFNLPLHSYLSGTPGLPFGPTKDQDPATGARSVLLEEFRNNSTSRSNKRYELKDIYNHIVEFSGDQNGSRFIQSKLETANSDEKDQLFREIEPNTIQLAMDVFGNYVIQKFFEHGNQVQKKILAKAMKGKVIDLSVQSYACRVVQKALEYVLVEQQAELVKELEPDVLKIVKDQNGNHVIQKIIEVVPRRYTGFIMDCFKGRVSELASHTYGCRVIQRVLEYGTDVDKSNIMAEIHNCAQSLITDQYGNYVTQHVIEHGKPEDRSKMIRVVTGQFLMMSKHKFASNVVEKCIEFGTPEERSRIVKELTTPGADGTSPLQVMMKDLYGNYVIQKLLTQLEGRDREDFVEVMRPQLISLKKVTTGRQITAIDRLLSAMSWPAMTKNGSPTSTSPASPALRVDVDSATPTPNLTMEPNSPSSSPPSTNASAVDEPVDGTMKSKVASSGVTGSEVQVNES